MIACSLICSLVNALPWTILVATIRAVAVAAHVDLHTAGCGTAAMIVIIVVIGNSVLAEHALAREISCNAHSYGAGAGGPGGAGAAEVSAIVPLRLPLVGFDAVDEIGTVVVHIIVVQVLGTRATLAEIEDVGVLPQSTTVVSDQLQERETNTRKG
jgi:hypothetical protein